jgi:hypothetical protein
LSALLCWQFQQFPFNVQWGWRNLIL